MQHEHVLRGGQPAEAGHLDLRRLASRSNAPVSNESGSRFDGQLDGRFTSLVQTGITLIGCSRDPSIGMQEGVDRGR
jgi:hypothetical protein